MDTTLIELLAVFLLAGIARLWAGGIARLWTISPIWAHHPIHAASRKRSLLH